jgi:HK97 family phage major capsid protein
MSNPNDLLHQRAKLRDELKGILSVAKEQGRDLTATEQATYNASVAKLEAINQELDAHARVGNGGRGSAFDQGFRLVGTNGSGTEEGTRPVDTRFAFSGIADFLRNPAENGTRASLSEGADLQYVVPGYEVDQFVRAYPSIDPLQQAGASITDLQGGWVDANVPIIVAGTEPSTYSEGSGPTNDESASVYVARLNSPSKYGALSKPTEEAMQDIPALAGSLGQEGIRRILNKVTKAVTQALCTQLASASATVAHSGDNYEDMLNMVAAIPTFFAGSSNVWMGSRRTKALLRNTRAGADNLPVFNAEQTSLLGYSFITNDYVPSGKLIFGDFRNGVYLRRSAVSFQMLNEAYREAGKIGLRFIQRADYAFFAEAANNSQSEQPLYLLTSDFGS